MNARITCTRRIQFCSGHRVLNHESKCRNLHGHNYVALFTAQRDGEAQDDLGRVIDFSVLKEKLGGWLDEEWDHGMILFEKDVRGRDAMRHVPGQKVFVTTFNPTAENMARHLLEVIGPLVLRDTGVQLTRVVLWETENCFAEVTL